MGGSGRGRRAEAGYNLVILIVLITLLNIALAITLPAWSQVIRREREEELISRGFQYAEAIRVFQGRFQRYPVKLEELIQAEPRSIRKLWKDPMTESGKWGLIFQGQPGAPLVPQPGPDGREVVIEEENGGTPDQGPAFDSGQPELGPDKGERVAVGPIVGVRSRSGDESILTFFGKQRYDEWEFRADMLVSAPVNVGGAGTPGGQAKILSTRWLGRPWPQFIQAPGFNQPIPQPQGPGPGLRGPRPQPQPPGRGRRPN
jgi:type II secretory pathway pseudopilin PulG